jgi:bifunctional UDP-N-acetylglucosamine pyrophosphorylase / glucosamine-1-phosphate N-acetyltransferase
MSQKLNIVILAAGKGTRMHSNKPKVLHKLAGKVLLQQVVDCAKSLKPQKIICVYGYGGDAVPNALAHENITWVEQKEQLGTGHAVLQVLPHLDKDAKTLILLGDVPLVNAEICQQLLSETNALGLLTVKKQDAASYGRIVRENSQVTAIVEFKDANEAQRKINEVNTGIIAARNDKLTAWVSGLSNQNAQKEYYLTDIVAMAVRDGERVAAIVATDEASVEGVNSKADLAGLERIYQLRYANKLMQQGVTLADPHRIDVRGTLRCGQDVSIDVGCVFEGEVTIGDNVQIGANCVIKNARIAAGTQIAAFSHIDDTQIGENNRIGPFARLRPGTVLQAEVHVGNFVELKNALVDIGSKINHLSYVGDSEVGKNVNIGAGTITCNYDGANKFKTIIEDDVFVGSDTQLVAPVKVGCGATIGAGSTITKDVPPDGLTLCRAKEQITIKRWKRPQKVKK